jgi:threonine/homoserine/homoserine lactone efflux protein
MQAKQAKNKDKTLRKSFFEGFITNVFNPKATLFFLSLFTTVISPETPVTYQALYGVTAAIMAVGWFSFVSIALTQSTIRKMLSSVSIWIDRVTGLMFVLLGLKIATEKIN